MSHDDPWHNVTHNERVHDHIPDHRRTKCIGGRNNADLHIVKLFDFFIGADGKHDAFGVLKDGVLVMSRKDAAHALVSLREGRRQWRLLAFCHYVKVDL